MLFKRTCQKAGILAEARETHEHYEKPSVRRKKKSKAARKRRFLKSYNKMIPVLGIISRAFFTISSSSHFFQTPELMELAWWHRLFTGTNGGAYITREIIVFPGLVAVGIIVNTSFWLGNSSVSG